MKVEVSAKSVSSSTSLPADVRSIPPMIEKMRKNRNVPPISTMRPMITAFMLISLSAVIEFTFSGGLCPYPRFFSCMPKKRNQKKGTPKNFRAARFSSSGKFSQTRPARNFTFHIRASNTRKFFTLQPPPSPEIFEGANLFANKPLNSRSHS